MTKYLEFIEEFDPSDKVMQIYNLKSIISTINEGIILVDINLHILFINDMAISLLNWPSIDYIGIDLFQYLPNYCTRSLLPLFNDLLKFNGFDNIENHNKIKKIDVNLDFNDKKILRFTLVSILDDFNQTMNNIVINIQDVSYDIYINETRKQFVSNLSHELRTPLCNVSSFLETLLDYDNTLTKEQKLNFLQIAHDETKRLTNLVNDILDLSRLESNLDYSLSSVNLLYILNNIITTFQLIAEKKGITLNLEIDNSINFVFSNEVLLFQVISNLISNSLKFTNPYGCILIRVYKLYSLSTYNLNFYINHLNMIENQSIHMIRVEVIDEGIGIHDTNQHIIFDRFKRLDNMKSYFKGTGLGLSIVKNILIKHQTNIILSSDLSIGTSISFDLLALDF